MGTLVGVVSEYSTPKGKSPFAKCKIGNKKVQFWAKTKEGDTNPDHALLYKAAMESRSVKVFTDDEDKPAGPNWPAYTQRTVQSAEWHEAVNGDPQTAGEAASQYSNKPSWKRDPETQSRIEAQWAVGNAAQVLAIENAEPASDITIQERALGYLAIVDQVAAQRTLDSASNSLASTFVSSTPSESGTASPENPGKE